MIEQNQCVEHRRLPLQMLPACPDSLDAPKHVFIVDGMPHGFTHNAFARIATAA